MLKRHQTRVVAYATTCITIIVIFLKLSSYNKALNKINTSRENQKHSNKVSERNVREVSVDSKGVDLEKIRSLFKEQMPLLMGT